MSIWVRCVNCQFVSEFEEESSLEDHRCGNCGGDEFEVKGLPEETSEPGEEISPEDLETE